MVCGRVLIINQGKIVAEDTPTNLAETLQSTQHISLEISKTRVKIQPLLEQIPGVTNIKRTNDREKTSFEITTENDLDIRDNISRIIIENDCSLLSMQMTSMSLEVIFLKLARS